MKAEINDTQIEIEPNSRPYLLKRILADGFDTVLIFALFMLFAMLILKTPLADTYHMHYDAAKTILERTAKAYGNDQEAVSAALREDHVYRDEMFAANLHSYLLKALSGLAAEALILLLVPFLNRNRCTPGKLMTGVMPFNELRQSRVVWYQILYRFLFVFLIDSLAFYLFTGILTFLLIPGLRLTEMLFSKKHKTLCDLITGVMIIEKLSYDGIN